MTKQLPLRRWPADGFICEVRRPSTASAANDRVFLKGAIPSHRTMKRVLLTILLGWVLVAGATTGWAADPSFTRTEDVIYGRKQGVALTMDVFTPQTPNGAAVIWAVSGGWFSGHDAIRPQFIAEFLKRG